VSPRKFIETQRSYKRKDLLIDIDAKHIQDSPVQQYIYDSLRSRTGPTAYKTHKLPEPSDQQNSHYLYQRNFSKESDM